MAKYILFGGADRTSSAAQKDVLAAEVQKDIHEPLRILSILFAEKREDWEAKMPVKEVFFTELFGKNIELQFAWPKTLKQQLAWANVVYIHGGDTALLRHYLDGVPSLPQLLEGKTVVGSSAGAEYLSAMYWTPDWREVKTGRGLVDAKVIVHYQSRAYGANDPRGAIDWKAVETELTEAGNKTLPLHKLKEGEFVVAYSKEAEARDKPSYAVTEYPGLSSFLHKEKVATIAVPIDHEGTIHAASLLYYHTEQPLAFYFVTNVNSEKCQLLKQQDSVKAACVSGTQMPKDFTFQMRGDMSIIEPEKAIIDAYYKKRGNRNEDISEPDIVCLKFTPTWGRFTDYTRGYERHYLSLSA